MQIHPPQCSLEIYICINKWPVANNSNDNSWLLFPEQNDSQCNAMHLEIYTCVNKWPVTNNSNDNSWLLFPEPEKVKRTK